LRTEKEMESMRTLMRVSMETTSANAAVNDGSLATIMQTTLEALKPEAAYFCAEDGRRTALIVFDLKNTSDIPSIAEPLFMGMNAKVDFTPCMNADDLRVGLDKATAARGKTPVLN